MRVICGTSFEDVRGYAEELGLYPFDWQWCDDCQRLYGEDGE